MKRLPLLLAALVLSLLLTATALASREVVRVGNLVFVDNGGISPRKLPRSGAGAPITARIEGEISNADKTHPPALQTLHAEIEKTISLHAEGLPTCRIGQILATPTATAKQVCGDAIIGSGEAEVEVAFPEQAPFSSRGPLVLFLAGVHGAKTTVLLHAYVDVPAPTAIVATAEVTKIHRGQYGLEIDTTIPRIAGGSGSVTQFQVNIGRSFTYKGKRQSLLTATCPSGQWGVRGQIGFADGTQVGVEHSFRCTPAG